MPRRNLTTMMIVAALSMICFTQVDRGLYAAKLRQIMNYIHDDGLTPASRRELFEAAAHGMVEALDDENTQFLPKKDRDRLNQSLDQELHGIGAELQVYKKRPRIHHVFYGQPAANAGLLPGDVVLAVDGIDTLEFEDLGDFVNKVKGKAGTEVQLTIERPGADEPLEFTIVRAVIMIESIKGYVRRADGSWDYAIPNTPNLAYLRIEDSFGSKTNSEFIKALQTIHDEKFAGLILDLRNNRGGRLDAAEHICNLFLPADKIILVTHDRNGKTIDEYRTDGTGPYQEIPLAVLINKGSASASEIVAGCLQDQGRAIVVGERSFGKGTVQRLFDVDGGRSLLKLTTASWHPPSLRNVHRSRKNGGANREEADESFEWGIAPNEGYEVVLDNKDIVRLMHHFKRQEYAAIDGKHALPDDLPTDEEPVSDPDPSKSEVKLPSEPQDSDKSDVDESDNQAVEPSAEETTPSAEETTSDSSKSGEKTENKGPFVDIQLQRAIEAIEKRIEPAAVRQAA